MPTSVPTFAPSGSPTSSPSMVPTASPSRAPTSAPTDAPTTSPATIHTLTPTLSPTASPSKSPTTLSPTWQPTTTIPTLSPTYSPESEPTAEPTTTTPTLSPTWQPTTTIPTLSPTWQPTTTIPTLSPTYSPESEPTAEPTTTIPTLSPTWQPTTTIPPSNVPTSFPTFYPSGSPTSSPSMVPTASPNRAPTSAPTDAPTTSPATIHTLTPTLSPTASPSKSPTTLSPTWQPTTTIPTLSPTYSPESEPTAEPTTTTPTLSPTWQPTTTIPTLSPTWQPTTTIPSLSPTYSPESEPTNAPTQFNQTSVPPKINLSAPNATTTNLDDEEHTCHQIHLEIVNFEGVSSRDFSESTRLQRIISNITNKAIHEVVSEAQLNEKLIVDDESYYVEFAEASGSPNIQIEQDLCAWSAPILAVVFSFIEDEDHSIEIANRIKYGIVHHGMLQGNMDMNVTIFLEKSTTAAKSNDPTPREISSLAITVGIMAGFLLFALIGFIDAKRLRRNDYFMILNIVFGGFDVCDTVLDLLFAVTITLHFNATQDIRVLVATISAYTCVVIPIAYSTVQLVRKFNRSWGSDDNLRIWWTDYSNALYLLSIFTGSSYTAVSILNCNAFQLELFSMGLSKQQRLKFNTKRLCGIVGLENIPQVAIQIWYLTTFGIDWTALLSTIFSLISIVVTVLTLCTQKTLIRNQQFAKISFNICFKEMKPSVSN
eukprot:667962_1